jgi:hypothetical protein
MTPPIPSPMIEQCARALWEFQADQFNGWDTLDSSEREYLCKQATAALSPLLNPTPEMIEAGASVLPEFHWDTDEDPAQVASVWQAMLHTALDQGSKP